MDNLDNAMLDALIEGIKPNYENVTRQQAIDYILDNLPDSTQAAKTEIGKYIYSQNPEYITEYDVGCVVDISRLTDEELLVVYSNLIYHNEVV